MPWAATRDTSFLASVEQTRADLEDAGFDIVSFEDTTETHKEANLREVARLQGDAPPRLSQHIVMGDRFREMRINSARSLADGRVRLVEALVRKPVG